MSRYYDYFQKQEHTSEEVTIDEFIAEAMRTDLKFKTLAEELHYQRTSRITLMNEPADGSLFLLLLPACLKVIYGLYYPLHIRRIPDIFHNILHALIGHRAFI